MGEEHKTTSLSLQAAELWERQRAAWPFFAAQSLAAADRLRRTVVVEGYPFEVCHNPVRLKSATARVSDGHVERPCFLCRAARPAEQESLTVAVPDSGHRYEVLVNPYPIASHHFTIVAEGHVAQSLAGGRLADMEWLASQMVGSLIFFNGAKSGASAPDHMHFQAIATAEVPMTSTWTDSLLAECGVTTRRPDVADDAMSNVMCWYDARRQVVLWRVVRRCCHRPRQYHAAGEEQILVSPAALEYAGLMPLARREDYDRMTPSLLADVLGQCERREPMVHVGIVDAREVKVSTAATGSDPDAAIVSLRPAHPDGVTLSTDAEQGHETRRTEWWWWREPFTLHDVVIGKQFHWEQRQRQTFGGVLRVFATADGLLHAVNILPVEDYLKSVISSEMSATNNLELLKAHAIISRSWLLRQLEAKRLGPADAKAEPDAAPTADDTFKINTRDAALMADVPVADRIVRWWDHDDHQLYDVCADDHCQRYQGITMQASPLVEQAVAATRGMVLLADDGKICDARFSKCCGGRSERFDVGWQDADFSYLQPVDDPWCNTRDERVLRLVLNGYDQTTVDFHDWRVTYTADELSDLVERKMHLGLGQIEALVPLKRGDSGRIVFLKVVGAKRTVVIGKELAIRKALSESHLYSSAFEIETSEEADGQRRFTLVGRGWGHGVGLCQIGAACMSQAGKTYDEILTHYFTGARITQLYL